MKINHVIIHRLIKEKRLNGCDIQKGKKLLPIESPFVIKLVEDLLGLFGKRENTATYGSFDSSSGLTFPDNFNSYHSSSRSAEEFRRITVKALESLAEKASSQNLATGGYLVFADYSTQNQNFFLISMIKEKAGLMINDDLEPTEQMEIDLSKLHQACRINRTTYNAYLNAEEIDQGSITYLAFVSQKSNQDASGYFIEGIGCKSGSNARKATKNIIFGTEEFFEDNSLAMKANEARNLVTEHLQQKIKEKKSVSLEEVGHVVAGLFPPEQAAELYDRYIALMNSEEYQVPHEFNPNASIVKTYTKIKIASDEGFNLNFDRRLLGTTPSATVYYDEEKQQLTFQLKKENSDILELVRKAETDRDESRNITEIQEYGSSIPQT